MKTRLKVLSGVRAGGFMTQNHSRTLQRIGKPRLDPETASLVRGFFAVRRRALRAIKAADAVVAMRRAQVAQ